MAFCLCQPFDCEDEGIISVSIQGSSSSRAIPGRGADINGIVPGPATGTVNITGYAFSPGDDKWLGVRCPSAAQASQTNYVKFNACTNKFLIIPSNVNSATLTGDDMDGVSFTQFSECGVIEGLNAGIQNGITIAQKTTTRFGHRLSFRGFNFPDLEAKNVFGAEPCFIQSLSINSNFPQPAQFSAGYQFIVEC